MIRLQATGVTTPSIPQTQPQPVQTKPSFKGDGDDFSRDELLRQKQEFEDFQNNPETPGFLKKAAKVGTIILTGVLGYGTAMFGMKKCLAMTENLLKSKPVKDAVGKAAGFVKETAIPGMENAAKSLKDSKIAEKASLKAEEAANAIKQSKLGAYLSQKSGVIAEKLNALIQKPKVEKVIKFIEASFAKLKSFLKGQVTTAKANIPTGEQVKSGAMKTVATVSGAATAITASEVENNENSEGEDA